jgi:glycosyltransferase involved in cell wall biosynthesis
MKSYNHASFPAESIESVLDQNFGDFELIIVDDASTYAARETIYSYAVKDSRIQVLVHAFNKDISKTINNGIENAKERFIAQIDSDDVWVG